MFSSVCNKSSVCFLWESYIVRNSGGSKISRRRIRFYKFWVDLASRGSWKIQGEATLGTLSLIIINYYSLTTIIKNLLHPIVLSPYCIIALLHYRPIALSPYCIIQMSDVSPCFIFLIFIPYFLFLIFYKCSALNRVILKPHSLHYKYFLVQITFKN